MGTIATLLDGTKETVFDIYDCIRIIDEKLGKEIAEIILEDLCPFENVEDCDEWHK